jgi:hypothetical protein
MKESLKLKTKDAEQARLFLHRKKLLVYFFLIQHFIAIQVASLHKGAETFQEVIDILLKKKHEPCDDEEKREHSTHSEQVLSAGSLF